MACESAKVLEDYKFHKRMLEKGKRTVCCYQVCNFDYDKCNFCEVKNKINHVNTMSHHYNFGTTYVNWFALKIIRKHF